MQWKSDADRYGAVAVAMHWITAAALAGLLVSGFQMSGADPSIRSGLLRFHAFMGVCVLALTLLRIAWWRFVDRKPAAGSGTPSWQAKVAWLVHRLFYAAILAMAASGIAMVMLSGAVEPLLAGGQLPDFTRYTPRSVHGVGAWLLLALVACHVGATLHHQFVMRDRPLARMGFTRGEPGDLR